MRGQLVKWLNSLKDISEFDSIYHNYLTNKLFNEFSTKEGGGN